MKMDYTGIKPYGDTLNDGAVQLSFTLPVDYSDEAKEAARQIGLKMSLEDPQVAFMKDLGIGYTFFVLYGKCTHTVDFTSISLSKVKTEEMGFYEINDFIEKEIGRKITVVAACTGSDAHTVGIDAIMNMKGYAGEYGLERYPQVNAHNLGSQVPNEELVAKAIELKADAILVSQVVTQKNVHVHNLTRLVELIEAEGLRDDIILIAGGPRISHQLAVELGYDAGFGPGTLPPQVASYIARELSQRLDKVPINVERRISCEKL